MKLRSECVGGQGREEWRDERLETGEMTRNEEESLQCDGVS